MNKKPDILDIIRNMFNPDPHRGSFEVVLFITATLLFAAFGNTLYEFFTDLSLLFTGFSADIRFRATLIRFIAATLGLALALIWMYSIQIKRYNKLIKVEESKSPTSSRGVIVLLSKYSRRDSIYAEPQNLLIALENSGYTNNRSEVLKTNWGTLAACIELHHKTLERVWLICTKDRIEEELKGKDDDPLEQAKLLIRHILSVYPSAKTTSPEFGFREVDAYSVQESANAVSTIYNQILQIPGLDPFDVTADFTGGTSAMSGGVQLAGLAQGYPTQYLRQDKISNLYESSSIEAAQAFTSVKLNWILEATSKTDESKDIAV